MVVESKGQFLRMQKELAAEIQRNKLLYLGVNVITNDLKAVRQKSN